MIKYDEIPKAAAENPMGHCEIVNLIRGPIGELYFYGGTLQNLLGAFNSLRLSDAHKCQ